MEYTINSRKLGKPVTFSVPGSSYIYVDLNGKDGCLGDQICTGGSFHGSTLTAYSNEDFKKTCKNWWKSYLRQI